MVKSVEFIDEEILDYLKDGNSAILLAYTNAYLDHRLEDGVLWKQVDENGRVTAVFSTGMNEKTLVFADDIADFEELSFMLNDNFISPNKLPLDAIDKKYLMHKRLEKVEGKKGIYYKSYPRIKGLEIPDFKKSIRAVTPKMFFNLTGYCEAELVTESDKDVSGGFISFGKNFAIITDIFTKEEYRGRGYGRALVEKLLKCSTSENVYLISEKHNLEFYKKLGFEIAKEIYEYENKGIEELLNVF